ncbi:hypothetical protein [Henriciella sp.]|uniref:hypothetical protein n=1 Tax=Henriciella sp. TaxID=1968823 RepID=UPI0026235663|nr:hypothetical protein [Henriciella sp.]
MIMLRDVTTGTFETFFKRLKQEAHYYADQTALWFQRRSDGEQIILVCLFILLLLFLIVNMSRRGKDPGSTGRQFGGSVVLVMVFAFALGLMIDTGAGSLSFLFQ